MNLRNLANRFLLALFIMDLGLIFICARVAVIAGKRESSRSTFALFERIYEQQRAPWSQLAVEDRLPMLEQQLADIGYLGDVQVSLAQDVARAPKATADAKSICKDFPLGQQETLGVQVRMCKSHPGMSRSTLNLVVSLVASQMVLLIVITIAIYYWVIQHLTIPLNALAKQAQHGALGNRPQASALTPSEFLMLSDAFERLWRSHQEKSHQAALTQISSQVAHDIRSPLAALDVVVNLSSQMQEEHRLLVRTAVTRIRDIANTMLEQHRGKASTRTVSIQFIPELVEQVVHEKRTQLNEERSIEVYSSLDGDSYDAFATLDASEFERVLSNLISNAVDAVADSGAVEVYVRRCAETVLVEIRDDGPGIDPTLACRLMEGGQISTKPAGNGLGFSHARRTIQAWGGQIVIERRRPRGTVVSMKLPAAPRPAWFAPEIRIPLHCDVAVLDDDEGIHQVWQTRLNSARRDLNVYHFYSIRDLREWKKAAKNSDLVYLCDYEMGSEPETGIDIIEELRIQRESVLITSHSVDPAVRARCQQSGIRLVPKSLAAYVPVTARGSA